MDAVTLLNWYDAHARAMPWRVPPRSNHRADPYFVWLSEVMLQQTTVAAVKDYFVKFTTRWPSVHDLAAAADEDVMAAWAGLGYYARARNLLKCARVVADAGGTFPDTEEGLLTLPGIGPYTAAAIASIAFDLPAVVLDGNVERVMARRHAVLDPLPDSKETLRALAARHTPTIRPGDYAQAVMDLGATICTPRNPACGICPWMSECEGRMAGLAAELPRKRPKKAKPTRLGTAYLARHPNGATLLETRPPKGLLGGMLALPTTDWSDAPVAAPPLDADWQIVGEVRHTFTHFHLILTVATATATSIPERGGWVENADPNDLPTVFAKAFRLGASAM
ncbi:A/G-specific DNA-adenine glycosylase [Monaibacterium marinum]|uniref:Adenine DNA glycosylase n=1 Tax=Pontivivens marinum TaxID=1690039 RepID=A0A2C9CPM7_9RHOB|nr:A/G-specific adenine glycosylase [Monaibacterium marinum]SOH93155.1 A/G-specific DNA-adenine glycosylase [Monaibacterium marinum]